MDKEKQTMGKTRKKKKEKEMLDENIQSEETSWHIE